MFQYSHHVDKKYPPKSSSPPPTDDTVVTPMSAAVTYGNLMFNDYKSEALATQVKKNIAFLQTMQLCSFCLNG